MNAISTIITVGLNKYPIPHNPTNKKYFKYLFETNKQQKISPIGKIIPNVSVYGITIQGDKSINSTPMHIDTIVIFRFFVSL